MSEWSWPAALDFSAVRSRISALFQELSLGPGSLYSEIMGTPPDPNIYPEVEWDAEVRLGEDLCLAERAFVAERKRVMRASFAQLMGVPEAEVDERDLPIVAIAGSGGGEPYRVSTSLGSMLIICRLSCDVKHHRVSVRGSICGGLGLCYVYCRSVR